VASDPPYRFPWEKPPSGGQGQQIGTLGVLAIAFGIGVLGAYMLDLHGHTCCRCGHKWRHLGALNVGNESSHTCSRCGTVQWWKNGVPHAWREGHAVETATVGIPGGPPDPRGHPQRALPSATFPVEPWRR